MSDPDCFFETIGDHDLECIYYPGSEPVIVLLHEGLGSVAMWRDFPAQLNVATGHAVFVYSRYGYGRSTPCSTHPVGERYMHREGLDVLPALLDKRGIEHPVLVGHSDGGAIALICAGGTETELSGVITLAAHVFNEDVCIASIKKAKEAFETTDLKDKLARYHDDPEGCFWLWNQAWLAPEFRDWNIEGYLTQISVPVLAIQGDRDEYGTEDQIHAIGRQVAGPVETLILSDCCHSPHRDQPEETIRVIADFVRRIS